ncbi:DUF6390 family protein [Virgisporangium aurantiacum]|uniref:Uncharacterized protein n=1 Tax=Virgisporangium aurantiacum TaxID=175570 RepID=A0A8J3YZX5_9ACTN|nr:DUF6390 family protein [Virgisporangium aurantiacum]GIJ54841.1 hypothetical protein Vau01_023570 [Virgisporangium aurantiacum]
MPVDTRGDVLFARYAFPPNALGYCGPDDPDVLLRHATSAGEPADEIARRARLFDGAWVYLELIAAAAGIPDPMDARVVEAYWIGNDLLDAVDPDVFLATLRQRFAGQLGGPIARRWRSMPPAHALAHHSFHVFAVYPWTGLLTAASGGRAGTALSVLDNCRIRWGTVTGPETGPGTGPVTGPVTGEDGARVRVRSRPLTWDGRRLGLGADRIESVRWSTAGISRPPPATGDLVACHWDWVCDRLTPAQVAQLDARTEHQLRAAG